MGMLYGMGRKLIVSLFLLNNFLFFSPVNSQEQRLFSMESVTIDIVMSRFYFLQRVLPAIRLLRQQRPKKSFFTKCKRQNIYNNVSFKNEHIIRMINDMQEQKSIHPLFCTWEALHCYKYIQDTTIMKEFTLVVVLIINSLYGHHHGEQAVKKAKESLDELSLEEMLTMLDFLIDEVPEFIDTYELNSSLSWTDWWRKYWLIAPLAAAALCIRLYTLYKKSIEGTQGQLPQQMPSYLFK